MEYNILLQLLQLFQNELSQIVKRELSSYFSESKLSRTPPENDTDKPINVQEASSFTNLAAATIYSLVSRKQIPFFKRPGSKRLYFLKSDLRKWLLEERHYTKSEIAADAISSLKVKRKRG